MYDLAVIGGGPAGLSAAITATTEGLSVVVIEKRRWGGQSARSPLVENYPGFSQGITGAELAYTMLKQAHRLGAESRVGEVKEVKQVVGSSVRWWEMRIETKVQDDVVHQEGLEAKAVLLACGLHYRRLSDLGELPLYYLGDEDVDVKGEYCLVVGAGNGAAQTALDLVQQKAESVYILCRGENIDSSMSQYLVQRIKEHDKIKVLTQAELVATDSRCATVKCLELGEACIPCSEGFVFIGAEPASNWLPAEIERDAAGYVVGKLANTKGGLTLPYTTNLPGMFIAGDLRKDSVKRIVVAAAEGAQAVPLVMNYLHLENA